MKFRRQAKILQLINEEPLETQEELSNRLREEGIETTQATVSRDIKELRLIKVMTPDGSYRYASAATQQDSVMQKRIETIFRESVTSAETAQNILVIKTLPGLANAAAYAIDAMGDPTVVGTLAGDDTVFCVMRDNASAISLRESALEILSSRKDKI